MDWEAFKNRILKSPLGKEIAYSPADLQEAEPIIALTETIRPRLVVVAQVPPGANLLVSMQWDKTRDLYQVRGRFRDSAGHKDPLPETIWSALEPAERVVREMILEFEKVTKRFDGRLTVLEFPPRATDKQIIRRFLRSGAFDIVRIDSTKRKAKRIA
jgi:hypothetical protein